MAVLDSNGVPLSREQWLRNRTKCVGASEIAILFGFGYKGKTPQQLWREKCFPEDHFEEITEGPARRGIDLEPIIIDKMNALEPHNQGKHIIPWDTPYIGATPDALDLNDCPTNIKTVAYWNDSWGEEFTDRVPPSYLLQMQQEMICCKKPVARIFAWSLGDWNHRWYHFTANKKLQNAILYRAEKFWDYVQAQECPPHDAFANGHSVVLPEITKGECLERPDLEELLLSRIRIANELSALGDQKKAIDAEITEIMGAAEMLKSESVLVKQIPKKGYEVKAHTVEPSRYLRYGIIKGEN